MSFAGHGAITKNPDGSLPMTTVPEGTTVTFITGHNQGLWDDAGQLLESGNIDEAINLQLLGDELDSLAIGVPNVNSITGAQTFLSGSEMPNYMLYPPDNPPINILSESISVDKPTNLSDILEPNMGCVNWAACTEELPWDFNLE